MPRPRRVDKDRIIALRNEGLTYRQIGELCGCSAYYAWMVVAKHEGRLL